MARLEGSRCGCTAGWPHRLSHGEMLRPSSGPEHLATQALLCHPMPRLDQLHHRDLEHAICDPHEPRRLHGRRPGRRRRRQRRGRQGHRPLRPTLRHPVQTLPRRSGRSSGRNTGPADSQQHRTPRPQRRRHRPGHRRPFLRNPPRTSPRRSACTSWTGQHSPPGPADSGRCGTCCARSRLRDDRAP